MESGYERREEKSVASAVLIWLVNSVALLVAASALKDKGVKCDSVYVALLMGFTLTLIAYIIEPVLYLLTLPINIATFGLFNVALNGVVLYAASALVPGFEFKGTLWRQLCLAVPVSVFVGFFRMLVRWQLVRMRWIRR